MVTMKLCVLEQGGADYDDMQDRLNYLDESEHLMRGRGGGGVMEQMHPAGYGVGRMGGMAASGWGAAMYDMEVPAGWGGGGDSIEQQAQLQQQLQRRREMAQREIMSGVAGGGRAIANARQQAPPHQTTAAAHTQSTATAHMALEEDAAASVRGRQGGGVDTGSAAALGAGGIHAGAGAYGAAGALAGGVRGLMPVGAASSGAGKAGMRQQQSNSKSPVRAPPGSRGAGASKQGIGAAPLAELERPHSATQLQGVTDNDVHLAAQHATVRGRGGPPLRAGPGVVDGSRSRPGTAGAATGRMQHGGKASKGGHPASSRGVGVHAAASASEAVTRSVSREAARKPQATAAERLLDNPQPSPPSGGEDAQGRAAGIARHTAAAQRIADSFLMDIGHMGGDMDAGSFNEGGAVLGMADMMQGDEDLTQADMESGGWLDEAEDAVGSSGLLESPPDP